MIFDLGELKPVRLNITPRICSAGLYGAIWAVAYGKPPATHVWDTYASRSFTNTLEIEKEIQTEQLRLASLGEVHTEIAAMRAIVLRSGFYKLAGAKTATETTISLSAGIVEELQSGADAMSMSLEDYIKYLKFAASSKSLETDI